MPEQLLDLINIIRPCFVHRGIQQLEKSKINNHNNNKIERIIKRKIFTINKSIII
jgi:hypothetical protein